jgi:EmrB/QacA subfamily drug resistance transporter
MADVRPQHTASFLQHKYRVFLICASGIFITVFDTSSAIVALPSIAAEFSADLTVAQWVLIANSLTIAALLVPAGRLSDVIGRKLIYVVGCVIFAAGSALCSIATSIGWLILARCIVGVGCAMTQGPAMAILVGHFAPDERGRMLGLQLGGVGLGAIAGPAIGGLIVGTIGWRMLFAIGIVTMLINGIAGQRVLRKRPQRPDDVPQFDYPGAVLFSATFVAGLLTLTLAPRTGWRDPATILGLAACLALALAFVAVERRHPYPMVDFRLFGNAAFSLGALAAVTLFMCMSATRFLTPFYLQAIKGFNPTRVGLLMLPAAGVTAIVAPFAGRLADRFGVRLFANIGLGIAILGLVIYAIVETTSPTWLVVVGLMTLALGMSFFGAPNSAAILNSVESGSHGITSGFVNLFRNSGNVIGIAFGTALVTWTMGAAGYPPSLSAVRDTAEAGLFSAFALGFRSVAQALILIALPVLILVTVWSIARARAAPARRRSAPTDESARPASSELPID